MKFCPECGTAFEPDARFCAECGFDKTKIHLIEPEVLPTAEATISEIKHNPVVLSEVREYKQEVKSSCPKCQGILDPTDRFCQECGFNTATLITDQQGVSQLQSFPVVEEIIAPSKPVSEPVKPEVIKVSCPKCGSEILSGERYCQQCGFEISTSAVPHNILFEPVEQPAPIRPPEPVFIPPVAVNIPPPVAEPRTEPVISQPPLPVREEPPAYIPPIKTNVPVTKSKGKKSFLTIVLIIFGLAVLGAAGWFGYNAYLGNQYATPADTITDMALPLISETDTSTMKTEVSEPPAETAPEQPIATTKPLSKVDQVMARQKSKTNAKPQSKIDQELARERAKGQNNSVKPPVASAQNEKSNPNPKDNLAQVILEVGKKENPKNKNPKNPVKLTLQNSTMIVKITTDHYNDGMGTSGGGTIIIKDRDDKVIATFRAYGKTGKDGTPDAKWVCEPHKVLEKGTYYIQDSDAKTWSKTFLGAGFVVVEGYEIE